MFHDPSFEVFRQDISKVGGTFVDQLSIMFHKSAANFLRVSAENRVPAQISCFTTLQNSVVLDFEGRTGPSPVGSDPPWDGRAIRPATEPIGQL